MLPTRLLAGPLPAVTPPPPAAVAALVAADAVRRLVARAAEGSHPRAHAVVVAGDLVAQYALERELVREGLDRTTVGPEQFVARLAAAEEAAARALAATAAELDCAVDVAGAGQAGALAHGARVAFVRLFEEGLLREEERVALACSRCATVVDDVDTEPAAHDMERVVLRFGPLEVPMVELELLAGVVAVAVPPGHPMAGEMVPRPMVGGRVLVLEAPAPDGGMDEPRPLVPAHDAAALAVARNRRLQPVPVVDEQGTVSAPLALAGMARFAARAAARDILAAEGAIVAVEPVVGHDLRCGACGTMVVPVLARHWYVRLSEVVQPMADLVRTGAVRFAPAEARDRFLSVAGARAAWCVSTGAAGGVPVPAAACRECGGLEVAPEPGTTCRRCAGTLEPDPRWLDARLLAAVWPLQQCGWPQDQAGPERDGALTAAVVTPPQLASWAVETLALGLRLTGVLPFAHVTVHTAPPVAEASATPAAHRLQLLAGVTAEDADALVTELDDPAGDDLDTGPLAEAAVAAMAQLWPEPVVAGLVAALRHGVPPEVAPTVRDLAAAVLGGDRR